MIEIIEAVLWLIIGGFFIPVIILCWHVIIMWIGEDLGDLNREHYLRTEMKEIQRRFNTVCQAMEDVLLDLSEVEKPEPFCKWPENFKYKKQYEMIQGIRNQYGNRM